MDLSFTVALVNTLLCAAVSYTAWFRMYSTKTMFANLGEKFRHPHSGLKAMEELHVPREWQRKYSEEFFDRTEEWLAYGVQILPFLLAKMSKRLVEISLVVVLVFVAISQDLPPEFNTGPLVVEWPDLVLAVVSIGISFFWPRYYLLSDTEKAFLHSIQNIHDCFYYGTLVPSMEKVNQADKIFFQECRRAYMNVTRDKEEPKGVDTVRLEARQFLEKQSPD